MKKLTFLLITIVFFACGNSNSPENVLEQYYENMLTGHMEDNIDIVVSADEVILSTLSENKLKKVTKELKQLSTFFSKQIKKEYEIDNIVIEEFDVIDVVYNDIKDKAKVTFMLKIKDAEGEKEATQILIKKDGKWCVSIFANDF